MVNFKQIRILDYVKREEEEGELFDEHGVVHPDFIIDDEGRSICTKHSEYKKIVELNLANDYPNEFELMLTCLRCNHYKQDHCFFPKSEIDKIERDRVREGINCKLCGMRIHRLITILHSFYYKHQFGVEMPIICCTCYAALNNNSFMDNTKKRMIFFGFSLFLISYFLIFYLSNVFFFSFLEISMIIVPLILIFNVAFRDIKSIYYLYRGRKYYSSLAKKAGIDLDGSDSSDYSENQGEENNPDH